MNKGHPQVIEIWNLVFIEFNRQMDGKLVPLPQNMLIPGWVLNGCMVLQGKKSNYDTDIFQPIISEIGKISGKNYGNDEKDGYCHAGYCRPFAGHLICHCRRAAAFQYRAGYVIRRILRRAVRYGYTFLDLKEPFIQKLVPVLAENMGHYFPELAFTGDLIRKVMAEEEQSFLRTLSQGIRKFEQYLQENDGQKGDRREFCL